MSTRRVFLVISIVGTFLLGSLAACSHANSDGVDRPVGANVIDELERASNNGLQFEQAPPYTSIQGIAEESKQPKTQPEVLYVGADFCPYCAATRWPLTIALMRFGKLQGLETTRSSAKDIYPDTTTFTFAKVKYSSPYIHFRAIETADRQGKALQPLQGDAATLFRQYDAPPYASHPGGIPFLYIGGHWLLLDAPVDPRAIGTDDWNTIAAKLADPRSELARTVLPQANLLTAAICDTTAGKPTSVCRSPGVIAASVALPPQ